jgi:cell division protein FtsW
MLYNKEVKSSGSGKTLTILLFLLVIFGLVMLASAGVVEGQKKFGSAYYFFKHQLLYGVLPGLIVFFVAAKIKPKFWKKISLPLLFVTIGAMILVFFPQFGVAAKGAQRWVHFWFIQFQPSEFLKLALIIYLAAWFSQRTWQVNSHWTQSVLPVIIVLVFIGVLLGLQPDLKTLTIITMIGGSMYFFSGAKAIHMISFLLIFAIIFASMAYFAPYRWNRIMAYLNPTTDVQGVAYHTNQAMLSIESAGFFGTGYGKSFQKINNLPEPVGDSIYAIIVEEMGFVGGVVVIGLFITLILTLINIAKKTSDQFGKLIVLGVTVWVSLQAFINVAAIIGLIPLTGVPLPFFSYGSSSLVSLFAGLGICRAIANHG